jgi:hypothetical protein
MKEINIMPRQSGKTTKILKSATLGDVIIFPNKLSRDYVWKETNFKSKNFYFAGELFEYKYHVFRGRKDLYNKTLYIDEWYFFKNKLDHYEYISNLINIYDMNLIIYSTSNKLYSPMVFDFVKLIKKYKRNDYISLDTIKEICGVDNDYDCPNNVFNELYYDFSTDPNVQLNLYHHLNNLSKEQYLTEFKGHFFE